jgi:enoyl-CoA hydratase
VSPPPAVTVADRGTVRVVTLDRAHARNAIDDELAESLRAALDELDAREDLSVAVITGAGGTFCAGMDLKAFAERPREDAARALALVVRRETAKPVIAAVEGHAVGGGCELAAACDLVVAARNALFGLPEVRRSLLPAGGGLLRLPRRLPFGVVMELGLTGRPLDAERLHALGFVARLSDPGAALDEALALAEEIVPNGPLAVAATKQLLWEGATADWERQDRLVDAVNNSDDAQEGVRSFVEKRAPRWQGR